jgi:23S rRNA (uracil1939-C5)-methyltransferase
MDTSPFVIETESLDLEANAIARRDGKVLFVRGALAREKVLAKVVRSKPKYDTAQTIEVLRPSVQRVTPQCPHYGVCGGCSMQHLDARAQVSVKQRTLEDNLWHLSKLKPETMLTPIVGSPWGYRFRARLSVRDVIKKGTVLVGFHEKGNSFVADMRQCDVMPKRISDLLVPFRSMIAALSIRKQLAQIEVAYNDNPGDGQGDVMALALRILAPLTTADEQVLLQFESEHRVEFWLQTKGPETVQLFSAKQSRLAYVLPEFNVRMPFKPTDFTQVNHQINNVMVRRALRLLDVQAHDHVVDFFCGLGNFTLPLARLAQGVIGIEGAASLVARAKANALENGLEDKTDFSVANLFNFNRDAWDAIVKQFDNSTINKLLIDPPREGALAVCEVLAALLVDGQPVTERIVYVSCNPATLARDSGILVSGGWALKAAGVINMFPHTSHVESIAVFEPGIAALGSAVAP